MDKTLGPTHPLTTLESLLGAPDHATTSRDRALATTQVAHALLFLPVEAPQDVEWRAAARFVLRWQLEYLRAAGIPATLVCGDGRGAGEWAAFAGAAAHVVTSTADFDMTRCIPPATPGALVLLMAAPCLTTLRVTDALASHRRSGRDYTVVYRQDRTSEPYLCVMNAAFATAAWPKLPPMITGEAMFLTVRAPADPQTQRHLGRAHILRSGTSSELQALERLWIARQQLPTEHIPAHQRATCLTGERHTIAGSARFHGPVLVGDGVNIGAGARVGPWVVLDDRATVGDGCWVEHAAVGAQATLEPESCVYRSLVEPGACATQSVPVLKARLVPGERSPMRQPSLGNPHELAAVERAAKRALDVLVASTALVLLAPLLLVLVALCLLIQRWPVFFCHERLGQNASLFRVYKFRTMRRESHLHQHALAELEKSARFKLAADPRVTPLGRFLRKTSLDELPQILNVLQGRMSIIGPRPIVSREAVRYGDYVEDLLRTQPGVTGLWQVNGRSDTSYQQRVLLDVKYGDTCSFWQDLNILIKTVPAVLLLRGAE